MVTIGEAVSSEFWGGRGAGGDARQTAGGTPALRKISRRSSVFRENRCSVVGVRFPVLGNVVVGRRSSVVSLK